MKLSDNLKVNAITIVILLCVLGIGVFIGRTFFAKTEIKIKDKIVYQTVYKEVIPQEFNQDNFNKLYACYKSPINFKERTENNFIYVTAFDNCKSADVKYEIGSKENWKIYAGVGLVGVAIGAYAYYKLK